MAVHYCHYCDNYVDLDWDVEHYEECPLEAQHKEEEAAEYWGVVQTTPAPGILQRVRSSIGW